jgi:hypothetical protein
LIGWHRLDPICSFSRSSCPLILVYCLIGVEGNSKYCTTAWFSITIALFTKVVQTTLFKECVSRFWVTRRRGKRPSAW